MDEDNSKIKYLLGQMDKLIERFRSDRNGHKLKALLLKLSVAFLSSVAVVLLGWQLSSHSVLFQNLALVINATIAVIATYEAFYKPKKLWIRETKVFSKLKDIKREIEFEDKGNTIDEERLREYLDDIHQVLNDSLEKWIDDKERES